MSQASLRSYRSTLRSKVYSWFSTSKNACSILGAELKDGKLEYLHSAPNQEFIVGISEQRVRPTFGGHEKFVFRSLWLLHWQFSTNLTRCFVWHQLFSQFSIAGCRITGTLQTIVECFVHAYHTEPFVMPVVRALIRGIKEQMQIQLICIHSDEIKIGGGFANNKELLTNTNRLNSSITCNNFYSRSKDPILSIGACT